MSTLATLALLIASLTVAAPAGGSHTELCPSFRSGAQARTASMVLPDDFAADAKDHESCAWSATLDLTVRLTLGAEESLAAYRADQVDPFVGDGGDDGIEDTVTYQSGVPVYGATAGEVLTYQPYNDGAPLDVLLVQADGVRLALTTARGDLSRYRSVLDQAAATLAVTAGRNRDSCTARGTTITYELPRGVRDTTSYGGPCTLYLPPRRTLDHLATFTVAPRGAGRPARPDRHVAERDGFRLVWRASPRQWAQDRSAFRRLLRSVEIAP